MGKYDDLIGGGKIVINVDDLLDEEADRETMNSKALYEALNDLQGELQQQLLDVAAREVDLDPALWSALDPALIQTIAAVQTVKDYLATKKI